MKNLTLIRHAKSSWETPMYDKMRPIMVRGIIDAQKIAHTTCQFLPDKFTVWSSPATRATQTVKIFSNSLLFPLESVNYIEDLYTFDEKQLEDIVKSCKDDVKNLIIFGHNGAITNFVNKFGDKFIENVPTSGVVSINFNANSWENISQGTIQKILFPKDLK
ncbi:histidine phosphatase family protein [Flavobacterium branchiophilum]|uniref:Putative phosphohistidine phosphatase, SixA n=1 Tax=Flavobacterium branchiophilum (strain FL-15) TaxID=1034807 RepID=G2Z1B3_FLABF|nr:histidine phosphatase family protein [Flavobacterium branchiophilum]CCB69676.1 Putative phosphohistidine phosphatase, SixA [Flavobacterium branchiophilum FL-15]